MNLGRLFRTVRHLKPVQIYGRLLPGPRAAPRAAPTPALRPRVGPWAATATRAASIIGPDRVRFLNQDGVIATPDQWNDPAQTKLWLYNLHYFDDLAATDVLDGVAAQRALVARWMAENPVGYGVGWEPYPTSLRIVNWIKWDLEGGHLDPAARDSLAVQVRWLVAHLEWRLLGNHLLANAKALIFAGLYFEGDESEGWLGRGLQIYRDQLREQVLADGGHFERSPMYHALMLEDVLDVWNLARGFGAEHRVPELPALAGSMRAWLGRMRHPDGQIAFFNDAAFGIAPEPAALEAYAARLGLGETSAAPLGLEVLRPSGYVRMARGPAVALIDCAPVGPDYLPGHAHADTLSFELSIGGARLIVNGGVSTYGEGAQRQAERATAAHSTVEIDGENSSEVWAGFRVGRRARILEFSAEDRSDSFYVHGAHDGYRWRPGRPVHRRTWRMDDHVISVTDEILGRADKALARFHLHPDVSAVVNADGRGGVLTTASGMQVEWQSSAAATLEASEWHAAFGQTRRTVQLVLRIEAGRLETSFRW